MDNSKDAKGSVVVPLKNQSPTNQLKLFEIDGDKISNADHYSQAIEIYDLMPKYSLGHVRYLEVAPENAIRYREWEYNGEQYSLAIRPATITKEIDGMPTEVLVYAGLREEIIEDAIRKLMVNGQGTFIEGQSACLFSLYQLREELKRNKHTYSIEQIKESLEVLFGTELKVTYGRDSNKKVDVSLISQKGLSSELPLSNNKDALTFVIFNFFVTNAIKNLDFRAFNYNLLMKMKHSLSRWFFRRLSVAWKQASHVDLYTIGIRRIFKDSGMTLSPRMTYNHQAVTRALDELIKQDVIDFYDVLKFGKDGNKAKPKSKIVNIKYTIFPSENFIAMQKKSSAIYNLLPKLKKDKNT